MTRMGTKATHVADSAAKSNDPHGDGSGAHGALERPGICEVRASHDASTAGVAVVVLNVRNVARCGYVDVTDVTY